MVSETSAALDIFVFKLGKRSDAAGAGAADASSNGAPADVASTNGTGSSKKTS